MTPPNPLTELAERVERLTGRCRETDALIAIALGIVPEGAFRPCAAVDVGTFATGAHSFWTAPAFTASLDAAMTLAVDGYYIIAIHQMPNGWIVKIGSRSNDQEPVIDEEHASLTHALCSAWLRARAASESSHG